MSSASLMLELQRWGEFLELASFLWIFLCGGVFLWVYLFRGVREMVVEVWGIYIMYRGVGNFVY